MIRRYRLAPLFVYDHETICFGRFAVEDLNVTVDGDREGVPV